MAISSKTTLLASAAAAIGASVCCVGPLLLLALGVGGAWVSTLTALEPVRPLLIGVTLVLLGLAFGRLYLVPQSCEPGTVCALPATLGRQRLVFWLTTAGLLALLSLPYFATLFY